MRPLYRRHDAASQAKYQELKQLARAQRRVLSGTPGTLKQRIQSGKKYWVREHIRIDGRKVDEYLGPEASLQDKRLAELRGELELAKALAAGSAQLRLLGYQRIDRKPAAVLEVFSNRGLIGAGLTLVGSHAYGALFNECGAIAAAYKTQDIDVARSQPLAVALPEGMDFARMLKESGPGERLGRVLPVRELRAHAQAVPLLDFLVRDPLDGLVLSPNQVIPVKLPAPERFVLHKLYSSQSRGADRAKVGKDLDQAATLAAVLEDDTPGMLQDAFRKMPAAGREKAKRGALAALKRLEGAHPQAEGALHRIAGRR